MLRTNTLLKTSPDISTWESLMRNINSEFRQETCAFFGIDPLDKIIVVGHQPVFFHPGILAKFIAASEVAKTCNAKLVHLVVDHHIGDV